MRVNGCMRAHSFMRAHALYRVVSSNELNRDHIVGD